MEQKKTLWIIAAVGAFLLVVLGGACIPYYLSAKNYPQTAGISPVEKYPQAQQSGWTNPSAQSINPAPVYPQDTTLATKVSDMVVVADNATVYGMSTESPAVTAPSVSSPEGTTIDLNALKRELYQEVPANAQPQNINITVNIPEPVKETTIISTTPEYVPETSKKSEPVKVVQEKPVEVKKVTKAPAAKPAQKTAAKPAPAPAPKMPTQYWVQVAAYSNKKGAEGARSILDENKIPSDIFTYQDNKDKLFYRVRVGPYTTKSEAEYWRSKIVKIDNFAKAESYVTTTN